MANDHSISLTSGEMTFDGLPQLTSAGGATLSFNGGIITYTPGASFQSLRAGEAQLDSFTYTIEDDAHLHGTGTVYVSVNGANDPPHAVDDLLFAALGVQTSNLSPALLGNDTDPDHGDTRTIVSVDSSLSRGTVTFNAGTGTILYQASGPGFAPLDPGNDSFTYTIEDGSGAQS